MTILECANQCFLVHYLSPRGIDDDTPTLHCPDLFLPHEMHSVRFERNVHAQHVRFATQRLDALGVDTPRGCVRSAVAVVIHDARAREGIQEVRKVEADTAEPEDADRARGEVMRVLGRDGGFPRAGMEGAFCLGEVAESGEDEVQRRRGGGFVDRARGVGHVDA